jgi:tetratricopeptide (TPR) repeat protein
MGYICLNKDCFAPENKKGKEYPVAMECPFCDVPLTQQFNFTEQEQNLLDSLPYVIAYPLQKTLEQTHYWTKLNLFKDTFLNYLKYLGLITASEFFNSDFKNRNMISLFQNTLAEPSFGTWNLFIRETLKFLEEHNHHFFCKELPEYYQHIETGKKRKLYKGEIQIINSNGEIELKKQQATAIGMLINFRNRYLGHGLTIDEDNSKTLWEEYSPIFFNLLEKMSFSFHYPMFKNEHGETIKLHSAQLKQIENKRPLTSKVWLENNGVKLDIIPFFIVPGELAISKEDKEQLLTYESYTGKSIKFFSPEGTEKQTSGKMLERLNLLLKEKQIEKTYSPTEFTEDIFNEQIKQYNKHTLQTLINEKKVIPGVYINRDEIESNLRNWIGSRASIFFVAAEAGSGKTNLLVEIQNYYNENGFKSLIIRAGRMNKSSLIDEVKHILNIDFKASLLDYNNIAGTQSNPTIILIDGLNEASLSQKVWNEILMLSKKFEQGSLKFVVTSRVNSQADLDRYHLDEKDGSLIYKETSDGNYGIKSFAFWLTPLNMEETKKAWEAYCKKDKSKFKPLFTFNDIAEIDRSIYDQINNPLILRVFLEVYNSKNLIQKGKNHINIWEDWFNTFNQDEKDFMMLLANEIWIKGENELLLEDLLNHSEIKKYLLSDTLNSPYPKLKNLGWIGRFSKDLDLIITFTVEGLLIYIIGKILNSKVSTINLPFVNSILEEDNILKCSGIEEYLSSKAALGDIDLITELIDNGEKGINISTKPLLNYIKLYGTQSLEKKLMKKPTEGDWKALLSLDKLLNKLSLEKLRKSLAETFLKLSKFESKAEIEFGLEAFKIVDLEYFKISNINKSSILNTKDSNLIKLLGEFFLKKLDFNNALMHYEKALKIGINEFGKSHNFVADCYHDIGVIWSKKGDFNKALGFYKKALENWIKIYGELHGDVAISYNNIGVVYKNQGDYDKAFVNYKKALEIKLKLLGENHPDVAFSLNNLGALYSNQGNYDEALELYNKALKTRLKVFGEEHPSTATTYNNLAVLFSVLKDNDKSLDYYNKALRIYLKVFGEEHSSTANTYNNLGLLLSKMKNDNKALYYYNKALEIRLKVFGKIHPDVANTYTSLGGLFSKKSDFEKALKYHKDAHKIRLKVFGSDNPKIADSLNDIGYLFNDHGNIPKSIETHEKALKIRVKAFGIKHLKVASLYNHIGLLWFKTGDYFNSIKYCKKSLEIRIDLLGEEHTDVTTLRFYIGFMLKKMEKYEVAIKEFKLGFIYEKSGGFPFNIAECYEKLNKPVEAIKYFKESAELRKKEHGIDDVDTIKAAKKAFTLAKENNLEHTLPDWINKLS